MTQYHITGTVFAVGIDPGVNGAVAALDRDGQALMVTGIPVLDSLRGGNRYDLGSIRQLLERLLTARVIAIEQGQPAPAAMGGARTSFARGTWDGWEWALVGMAYPGRILRPLPRKWQRAVLGGGKGDTKDRSVQQARRLWPSVPLRRTAKCRKDDDGFADALLLAEWGRHEVLGATPTASAIATIAVDLFGEVPR